MHLVVVNLMNCMHITQMAHTEGDDTTNTHTDSSMVEADLEWLALSYGQ
jgi:hypothetical protein